MFRMRAPLSLVAVLLVIALVAAVLIGGRLYQDWKVFHGSTPAGQSQPTVEAQLEARPLHIPRFTSQRDCVTGPFYSNVPSSGFGSGPVYGQGGSSDATAWGVYWYIFVFADTPIRGPVLIRAVHLFGTERVVFIGPNAAGQVVGTDTVNGQQVKQRTEALIDTTVTASNPGPPWQIGTDHPFNWPLTSGETRSAQLTSTGWQIDGPDFSETFVVC